MGECGIFDGEVFGRYFGCFLNVMIFIFFVMNDVLIVFFCVYMKYYFVCSLSIVSYGFNVFFFLVEDWFMLIVL